MPGEGEAIEEKSKKKPEAPGVFYKGTHYLTPEQQRQLRPEWEEDLKKSRRLGEEAMERNAAKEKAKKG